MMTIRCEKIEIKGLISPILVFLGSWGFVCILLELRLSNLLDGIHDDFAVFLLTAFVFLLVGYVYTAVLLKKKKRKNCIRINVNKLYDVTKKLCGLWIVTNVIQIIYSGGIPMLWYITGDSRGYFDFGIHGINGLANSVFYILFLNVYLLVYMTRKRVYKIWLIAMLIWPILLVTRQVFIVCMLETTFMVLSIYRVRAKTIIKIVLLGLLLVYGFGILGDFRSGADSFKELAQPAYDWLYVVPSGILWVYIYLSTPIANIQNIFETIQPTESFVHSMSMLLPSPVRALIYPDGIGDNSAVDGLITEAFNVSTFLNEFYLDYGTVYVYISLFIIGMISAYIYNKVRYDADYAGLLCYCVLQQILLLSIFFNHFLYLPVVFQFVIIVYVAKRIKSR